MKSYMEPLKAELLWLMVCRDTYLPCGTQRGHPRLSTEHQELHRAQAKSHWSHRSPERTHDLLNVTQQAGSRLRTGPWCSITLPPNPRGYDQKSTLQAHLLVPHQTPQSPLTPGRAIPGPGTLAHHPVSRSLPCTPHLIGQLVVLIPPP